MTKKQILNRIAELRNQPIPEDTTQRIERLKQVLSLRTNNHYNLISEVN